MPLKELKKGKGENEELNGLKLKVREVLKNRNG
jgi:hypothetical protein